MDIWFITGTSSGLGRSLAEELLARGHQVAAALRSPTALDDLAQQYPERLRRYPLDVRKPDDVRSAVDRAVYEFGRLDVVVNNAGYGVFGAVEELTDDQIERIVQTNLLGSIYVARAALPHLRAQGGGRIVQISSEGGQTAYPAFSAYHATKWGIEGFIESLATEVAVFGIRCSIIEFGPTATNFSASLDHAATMLEYETTPVGELRRKLSAGTAFSFREDPRAVAQQIVDGVTGNDERLRVVIGAYAYDRMRKGTRRSAAGSQRATRTPGRGNNVLDARKEPGYVDVIANRIRAPSAVCGILR